MRTFQLDFPDSQTRPLVRFENSVRLFHAGLHAEIWEGEYGLFRQNVLMPDPELDAFAPQVLFFATHANDAALLHWNQATIERYTSNQCQVRLGDAEGHVGTIGITELEYCFSGDVDYTRR